MSVAAKAQINKTSGEEISAFESVKRMMKKWSGFDEETGRGSVVGKVFTGCYVLIFGWFFIHSIIYFSDILFGFNIPFRIYAYYHGSFLLSVLISGGIFVFLLNVMTVDSLSDDDAMRWPLKIGCSIFTLGFVTSNMASEPYPNMNRSWFGSDLRYPEFMGYSRFYPLLLLFTSDMNCCFSAVEEEKGMTYMFRPYRKQPYGQKKSIYEENYSGIVGVAFIYFSYWYFMFASAEGLLEGVAYYAGIRLIRNYFSRGEHFENGRKQKYWTLSLVPLLAILRGYFACRYWRTYDDNFIFCSTMAVLLLHVLIFAGWISSQKSWLGAVFLPFKCAAGFADEIKEEGEGKKLVDGEEDEDS